MASIESLFERIEYEVRLHEATGAPAYVQALLRRSCALKVALQSPPCVHPHQSFRNQDPQYGNSTVIPVPNASSDTRLLVRPTLFGLKKIYRPGYAYKKAGVMLMSYQ